ncbi:MAG: hypothetical protein KA175_15715 [Flavobacteriales bacterium]|nr:hypothetical protein [Flavobacteriales bacterium]MBP6699068.1 hypothetical protein [Flavobacteriales bacterium]
MNIKTLAPVQKILSPLGVVFTLAIGLLSLYLQYKSSEEPTIEVRTISVEKLTQMPSAEGLEARFTFHGRPVTSLWRVQVILKNIGLKPIVGVGDRSDLIDSVLTLGIPNGYRLLDVRSTGLARVALSTNGQDCIVAFRQWKSGESFDVLVFLEAVLPTVAPQIRIDERGVVNGRAVYSSLNEPIVSRTSVVDYFPSLLREALRWVGILLFSLVFCVAPWAIFQHVRGVYQFNRWKRDNKTALMAWLKSKGGHGNITATSIEKLPNLIWQGYPPPRPTIPSKWSGTGIILMILLLALLPMLWLVEVKC